MEEMSCSLSLSNSLNEENKKTKLFIEMKKVEPSLVGFLDKERQVVQDEGTDRTVAFIRNDQILGQLMNEMSFGTITAYSKQSENSILNVRYNGTVNLKSSSDKKVCHVSGMVLVSPSQMCVADYNNMKIKLTDVDNGKLVSEITLRARPWDVIKLPQNKLAVALGNEKYIQIISYTTTSLTLENRKNVGDRCYCVAYCNDKLVIGCNYNPGKVIIMGLDGNIVQEFDEPGLFDGPEKIIISRDEKFLFVSDFSSDISRYMRMDLQGNIEQKFDHPTYKNPKGILELEDGSLLVCYHDSNNIVRLSSSFNTCEIAESEKVNLYNPTAIAYNEKDHKLYISCSTSTERYSVCDLVKVFEIKWI